MPYEQESGIEMQALGLQLAALNKQKEEVLGALSHMQEEVEEGKAQLESVQELTVRLSEILTDISNTKRAIETLAEKSPVLAPAENHTLTRLLDVSSALVKLRAEETESENRLLECMDALIEIHADKEEDLSEMEKSIQAEIDTLHEKIARLTEETKQLEEERTQLEKTLHSSQAEEEKEEKHQEEDSALLVGRFHPLLPTPEQARDKPDLMLTDHLPEVVQCGKHKIIMMNLYNPSQFGGFDPYSNAGDPAHNAARAARLIDALVKMVVEQNAGGICTEEFWLGDEDLNKLKAALKKATGIEWVVKGEGNTFYFSKTGIRDNNDELQQEMDTYFKNTKPWHYEALAQPKPQIANHPDCVIINIHLSHQNQPNAHAAFLKEYVSVLQKKVNKPIYVVGDANICVLAEGRVERKEYGVTSVTPAAFRRTESLPNGVQGADYGHLALAFYPDGKIEQLASDILNPHTGKVFVLRETPQDLTEIQKAELKEFRPALVIGTRYENLPILSDMSIDQYTLFLQKYFGEKVSVYIAINAFSEVGLTLIAPKEIYDAMYENMPKKDVTYPLRFRNVPPEGQEELNVPLAYASLFHTQLMKAYAEKYKPMKDAEILQNAPKPKKSLGLGLFTGSAPHPVLLPDYHFHPAEILPKAAAHFYKTFSALQPNALSTAEVEHVNTLKEGMQAYAMQHENHFVRIFANLVLAECLLMHHGKTERELKTKKQDLKETYFSETHLLLANAHLTQAHVDIGKSGGFLSEEERGILRRRLEEITQMKERISSIAPEQSCAFNLQNPSQEEKEAYMTSTIEQLDSLEKQVTQLEMLLPKQEAAPGLGLRR